VACSQVRADSALIFTTRRDIGLLCVKNPRGIHLDFCFDSVSVRAIRASSSGENGNITFIAIFPNDGPTLEIFWRGKNGDPPGRPPGVGTSAPLHLRLADSLFVRLFGVFVHRGHYNAGPWARETAFQR